MADDTLRMYGLVYFNTRNAIIDAMAICAKLSRSSNVDTDAKANAAVKGLELQRKLSLIDRQHDVFMADEEEILNPPTDAEVNRSVVLAETMSKVLAEDKTTNAALLAVSNAASAFAKYQNTELTAMKTA